MNNHNKIASYIEMCFEELGLIYDSYFNECNNSKALVNALSGVLDCEIKSNKLDDLAITHTSRITGIAEKDIRSTNENPIYEWHDKYSYFELIPRLHSAYNSAYYADGDARQRLISCIFDDPSVLPTRFNEKEIVRRLWETLLEIEQTNHGAIHENAKLEDIKYTSCTLCSFPKIEVMVDSYLKMFKRVKELLFKAMEEELSEFEIQEYNMLVSVFGLGLKAVPSAHLYYDNLLVFKGLGKTISEETFNKYIKLRCAGNFKPWICKEFIEDRNLVQRYVDAFPEAKGEMRAFAVELSTIECSFSWSDEEVALEDEEDFVPNLNEVFNEEFGEQQTKKPIHRILIEKNEDELFGFKKEAELLKSYCRPGKLGGLKINFPKNNTDGIENVEIIRDSLGKLVRNDFFSNFEHTSPYLTELIGGGNNE